MTAVVNPAFDAAVERVQGRLEAALGMERDEIDNSLLISGSASPEQIGRVLVGDLFPEPEQVDMVVGAFKNAANMCVLAIALGCEPPNPIAGGLAQMFATGCFYGEATPAARVKALEGVLRTIRAHVVRDEPLSMERTVAAIDAALGGRS